MRRTLALAVMASLMPMAALADEIGAREDIVVEEEKPVVKETVVREEKPVTLAPPGWQAPKPADDSDL